MITFVGSTGAYDAYKAALDTGKMGNDLANKYANYVDKKLRQIKRNRTSLSGVDAGRSKVYQSEFAVQRKYPESSVNLTEKECEKYFKRIVKSKTYQTLAEKGNKNPSLRFMKASNNARIAGQANFAGVALRPGCGTNKYTILHELAHTAGFMHHDVGFRQTLVKLVSRFLGTEMAKDLKKEFKSRKLKMTISQNIKTPLQWLESYQKMQKVRGAL